MYCSQCGTETNLDDKFCQHCGVKLQSEKNTQIIHSSKSTVDKTEATSPQDESTIASSASEVPINQSRTFLGGIHHPWRRYFAKWVDLFLVAFPITLLLGYIVAGFVQVLQNPITAVITLCLVWVPVEATFIATTGTTPAKWLFGIHVLDAIGKRLSYSKALKRAFLVSIQGEGLQIPIVSIFSHLYAYQRLTKTGSTLWDTSAGSVVTHKKWGVIRTAVCILSVLVVLTFLSILEEFLAA